MSDSVNCCMYSVMLWWDAVAAAEDICIELSRLRTIHRLIDFWVANNHYRKWLWGSHRCLRLI